MNILPQNKFVLPQRRVGPGKQDCYYLDALYSTLVQLRPKTCLEIGTHTGNTAKVFQEYFDLFCPDGTLVTCDIKRYVDLSHLKNVKQVIVSHHIPSIRRYHNITEEEIVFNHSDSVRTNTEIVGSIFKTYDFAFIDGDHTRESFLRDVEICENLLIEPKIILIDDTKEPVHECMKVYEEEIKKSEKYNCYDFEDWKNFVGSSLVIKRH